MCIAYEFQRCLPQTTAYVNYSSAAWRARVRWADVGRGVVVGGRVLMPALLIVVGTRTCSSTGGRRKNGVRVPLPALVFFIAVPLMVVAAPHPP